MRTHIELTVAETLWPWLNHVPDDKVHDLLLQQRPELSRLTSNSLDVSRAYLASSILKKWKGFIAINESDTRAACLTTWYAAEQQCFATNYKLASLDLPITDCPFEVLIRATQEAVISMIGRSPNINACIRKADWPTGATYSIKSGMPVHANLTDTTTAVSPACYYYAREIYRCIDVRYVYANRFATVPKTCKTDRPIACEPALNALMQKGAGRVIRQLLLQRCGIDLNKQADENRDLALLAKSCDLCTIDLESASDTIAYQLVKLLLPASWFHYLDALRTQYTEIDGKRVLLEKFSGMGNGFTFELETVLFRAITVACYKCSNVDGPLAVFGDDIICSKSIFRLMKAALTFFGFKINEAKTFARGSFYESCGRDYLCEEDITPCYVKDVVETLPQYIVLHNKLFRWATRTKDFDFVAKALSLIRREARIKFNLKTLPRQPAVFTADLGFISDSGFKRDKHGDYILHYSVISISEKEEVLEQGFYLQNWLRGGKSFTDTTGNRVVKVLRAVPKFVHKQKVWACTSTESKVDDWVVD